MKKIMLALGVVVTALMFGLAVLPVGASGTEAAQKVFVCKYKGTPGVDETLQGGNNPISTDLNSIPTYDPNDPTKDEASELVGDEFSDAQGRSLVLVEDTGQEPEPDAGDCPPPNNPCPTGTTTVTVTETVTATAAAAVEDPCTVTETETITITPPPPREVITGSISHATCENQTVVATGDNPGDEEQLYDVFVNGVLVDSFAVDGHSSDTSAAISVKDGDIVTLRVQGGEADLLDVENVELECVVTSTTPPPTTTVPPPTPACPGSVTHGPWYGDPLTNITLKGSGTFVVSGGVQRFSNLTTITKTLACGESFLVGRYKVQNGHTLSVTLNGVSVISEIPPVTHRKMP